MVVHVTRATPSDTRITGLGRIPWRRFARIFMPVTPRGGHRTPEGGLLERSLTSLRGHTYAEPRTHVQGNAGFRRTSPLHIVALPGVRIELNQGKAIRRVITVLVGGSLAIGTLAATAQAESALPRALHDRKAYVHDLANISDDRRVARQNLHHQIRALQWKIAKVRVNGPSLASDRQRWSNHLNYLVGARRKVRVRIHGLERYVEHRTDVLRTQRSSLTTWIQTFGILRECPVRGAHVVANDFGYIVQKRPGVPLHVHQGNDITAAYGAPIVAPFDGIAVASTNTLGGLAVDVYGAAGYVYNAHLSAYGKLGRVKTGDVIGYVGSTGDAGGPHDHFEWHPDNGAAVDPYPYLMAVC